MKFTSAFQLANKVIKIVWLLMVVFFCLLFFLFYSVQDALPSSISSHTLQNGTNSMAALLELNGGIGPAVQDYMRRGFLQAQKEHAEIIIIRMNTPGGLDVSMREIIKDILSSPIPVISYVAPSGARAASAGTFILYASHIAAMAPATNLGAATPVNLIPNSTQNPANQKGRETSKKLQTEKTPEQIKTLNDAKAYIRSLAELRNRNVQWAESAVTKGASLSAQEALQAGVINFIAKDIPDLLTEINLSTVQVLGKPYTIHSEGLKIQSILPDWRVRFLARITDPSVAYLLLMIGFYGLLFEFLNPGFLLPGVAGAISLLISLYALQLLPINYAGLFLILLGLSFAIAEVFMPTYGSLGVGGMIAFLIGSIMLFKSNGLGAFHLPISTILAITLVTGIFFIVIFQLTWRSQKRPIVSGKEWLIGKTGEVIIDDSQTWVLVLGEHWQAHSKYALQNHQSVKVIAVKDLILEVEPFEST